MDSIKERFINKFMGHDEVASEAIFAFIKEELNKLSDEVTNSQVDSALSHAADINEGIRDAATIIRTQADLI